jgi:hypothetical protein
MPKQTKQPKPKPPQHVADPVQDDLWGEMFWSDMFDIPRVELPAMAPSAPELVSSPPAKPKPLGRKRWAG